jgi:MarR family 2-MHQ and catechol resistance regulon transcriptional repressor
MATHYEGTAEERQALDLFVKLMRAADAVGHRTSAPLAADGLTPVHFGVLETLYHLGPLMISQLADKHLRSRNNFTVVIDNLERQGLVRRERDDADRRSVQIHLTEAGRARVEPVIPKFVRAVVEDMKALDPNEQRILATLLRRLGRQEQRQERPAEEAGESVPA